MLYMHIKREYLKSFSPSTLSATEIILFDEFEVVSVTRV